MTRGRLYGFIAVVAVLVVVSAFLVTRNTRQEVRASDAPVPGYRSEERRADDAPFEFAGPSTTAGPTTIPGGQDALTRRTTTTTSTTTTLPPTTTTTIPTAVVLPPPDDIRSICGMHDSIFSIQLIWTDPSIDVQQVAEQLQSNMNRYLAVSPPELRDEVDVLRNTIIAMADRLRTAGWNTNDGGVRQLLKEIESQAPPFERFVSGMNAVRFAESALCPQ
jgi:hypothetical protein